MAQLPTAFDPTTIAPSSGGGKCLPISDPKGHMVVISDSDMKQTKDQQGYFVEFTLTICEGPLAGQSGAYRINLVNQSAEAVRIGLEQLSALCHVIGYLQRVDDTSVLHNRPFRAVVHYQKGKEQEGYTEVSHVLTADGRKATEVAGTRNSQKPTVSPSAPAPAPAPPPVPAAQQFPSANQQQPQQQPQIQNVSFPQQQQTAPAPQPQQFAPPQQPQAPQYAAPQYQQGASASPPWAQ